MRKATVSHSQPVGLSCAGTQPLRGWRSAVGACCLVALSLVGAIAVVDARARADEVPMEDLIFTSDDDAWRSPGCDAHSVINARTGAVVARGERIVSTGRLAVTNDGSMVVSVANNSDRGSHIYVLRRDPGATSGWVTQRIGSPVPLIGSPMSISPNDQFFLIATRGGIDKYPVSDLRDGALRSRIGRYEGGRVGELLVSPDSRTAYVIDVDGWIHTLDTSSMSPSGNPIRYEPVRRGDRRRLNTHAALSEDGQYLLVNSGAVGAVNVIDLKSRKPVLVDVEGLRETWDVAYNYEGSHRGLVAVHGRDAVAVFRFEPPDRLELVDKVRVPPQQFAAFGDIFPDDIYFARIGTLAWTGSGDGVVAAVGLKKEYRVLDLVEEDGYQLEPRLDFDSCEHGEGWTLQLDVMTMNLLRPPSPSPTALTVPSATATRTATNAPPPTATVVPPTMTSTMTAVPSPTPTAKPQKLYVPIAVRERCVTEQQRQDVVMAIDTSSSMIEPAAGGRRQLDVAKDAALHFVGLLHLSEGDRAAVISFDAEARILAELTTSRPVIEAAIVALQAGEQTCLPCAVELAADLLRSPSRPIGNSPVMILLTDGRSNPRPASEAVEEATEAKREGVVIFTIGLGNQLDFDALEAMASERVFFYRAPDAEDLAAIYEQIAVEIPCPPSRFWGRR